MMKKNSQPKPGKLPKIASPWRLFRTAWRDLRTDWLPYTKILAAVTIPANLLLLVNVLSTDAMTSAYLSFATLIMNIALVWAIIHRRPNGRPATVAQAYYDGSVAIVRYTLVSTALVLMLIPAAFGVLLYAVGLITVTTIGAVYAAEQALIGFAALLLATPTFFLLVRYSLAVLATIQEGLRPVAALRRSFTLTRGRFWAVAGRLLALILILALASLPVTVITILLAMAQAGTLALVTFQVLTTFIALPLANLYLIGLYRELDQSGQTVTAAALDV
jgi:hypothetical protein